MLQVIEKQEDAGKAECIKFRVYPSPNRHNFILGEWTHTTEKSAYPKGALAIASSQLGTSVEIEYQHVMAYAHENGIPFVWVDDPRGLFPPSDRPSFQIRF